MAEQTSMLHVRVDEDTKPLATQTLAVMGLSVSDTEPLEMNVPNAETRAAMEESRVMRTARRARFASAEALFEDLVCAGTHADLFDE